MPRREPGLPGDVRPLRLLLRATAVSVDVERSAMNLQEAQHLRLVPVSAVIANGFILPFYGERVYTA